AEEQLERHFFRRLGRLIEVRWFVASWLLLMLFLIGTVVLQTLSLTKDYASLQPVPGGTFTEGLLGSFTDANPLYATGLVDSSVSKLLFASLFKIDQSGKLVGDLASKWTVDDRAVVYTVYLRDNLKWHDGQALTADDAVFTYQTIQNADTKSPLFSSWRGISVVATNSRTITFTLPNALGSFPYSLTNGIVPKHLLRDVPANQLRSIRFNSVNPVGSGPFMWERVEVSGDSPETREEQIGLIPFKQYYGGVPKLDHFTLRSFHDQKQMITSFQHGELNAIVGLDSLPDMLKKDTTIVEYNVPLAGEVAVFLKTSDELFQDTRIRLALTRATNQQAVLKSLGYPVVGANEPLLRGQPGYDKTLAQQSYNMAAANSLLDEAGWARGKDGLRFKNGKALGFNLFAPSTSEATIVSQQLQQQWRRLGIDAHVQLEPTPDLQGVIARHDYDALLYGISIGPDPDVFVYWHSSQADPHSSNRLNLSEYKSPLADKALEAGRSRTDVKVRVIKYRPFLEAWPSANPGLQSVD
ncbi:hypothetical protein HY218_00230, partial [Candidatus Saccharibacteria bacterium]|nr:hypothetical protein [Candidatus Saccharibacteria bacterium]